MPLIDNDDFVIRQAICLSESRVYFAELVYNLLFDE